MIISKNLKIPKNTKFSIDAAVYLNEDFIKNNILKPIIIFAHGFKGFKDWGGFPYLCSKLAENDFIVLSFNFTHNGVAAPEFTEFTRLDLFAENTHTKELEDLKTVLEYIPEISREYNIDLSKIGLIGHSRGGGISVISAAENPDIKALVTLASISDFMRYTPEQIKRWKEKGCIEMPNTRTNQMMRMNVSLLEDIENNLTRLDITGKAAELKIPYLIIHGTEDLAVKYTDAEKLYKAVNSQLAELVIIENTGHTFGVEHPFKGTSPAFEKVIELTVEFFKRIFKEG